MDPLDLQAGVAPVLLGPSTARRIAACSRAVNSSKARRKRAVKFDGHVLGREERCRRMSDARSPGSLRCTRPSAMSASASRSACCHSAVQNQAWPGSCFGVAGSDCTLRGWSSTLYDNPPEMPHPAASTSAPSAQWHPSSLGARCWPVPGLGRPRPVRLSRDWAWWGAVMTGVYGLGGGQSGVCV